eukprot:CAMPEP_0180654522 /NCGR_PEP_ID=MMETSP1037_2-20121125/54743_1 /TAXON_ID=632150 /ORGANISM="Azadinium spinosum, Strain 3D9" /LENGTH=156 /DNA_ID=CAMNT_0022680803 /DNA_START=16 /DNA_END=483 /DNA_ORIENTATION=-
MPMGRTRKVTKTPTRAARGMATATGRCCEKCLYFVCTLRSEKRGHVRPSPPQAPPERRLAPESAPGSEPPAAAPAAASAQPTAQPLRGPQRWLRRKRGVSPGRRAPCRPSAPARMPLSPRPPGHSRDRGPGESPWRAPGTLGGSAPEAHRGGRLAL